MVRHFFLATLLPSFAARAGEAPGHAVYLMSA
jgi:hypothetical protein